jgi:hypothetical protein
MPYSPHRIVLDFQSLFESPPGLYLVRSPQKPYEIVAVSTSYLAAAMTTREQILGRALLEAFPDPAGPLLPGRGSVTATIETAVRTGKADSLAIQKYDMRGRQAGRNASEEQYWSSVHFPIYLPDGRSATS